MKVSFPLAALASTLGLVSAGAGTSTDKTCTTFKGSNFVKYIPTKSIHRKETYIVYSTKRVQNIVTITPKPRTTTATITKFTTTLTTNAPSQVTEETRTTEFATTAIITYPSIDTIEITATETADRLTVTITAASAFYPIRSSITGSSSELDAQKPGKRGVMRRGRHQNAGGVMVAKEKRVAGGYKPPIAQTTQSASKKYAQSVRCEYVTHVPKVLTKTTTQRPIYTTAKAQTSTQIRTVTVVSTSTIFPPDVTTTKLVTVDGGTLTSTTVRTTTATVTTETIPAEAPMATEYEACRPNNFASRIGDSSLGNPEILMPLPANVGTVFPPVHSLMDCCIACVNQQGCMGGFYRSQDNTCSLNLDIASTCMSWGSCTGTLHPIDGTTSTTFFNGGIFQWKPPSVNPQ